MAELVDADELRAALGVPVAAVPDDRLETYCEGASQYVLAFLDPAESHDLHPLDRQAALTIAVTLWQDATAVGGSNMAADYTPGPYTTGRSLLSRISGLIAPCRTVRTLAV